ncbi:MAG TPA: fibronectin type III domain-containing protein [bacterium]|nr:fibronectin type III domain-containing protein [bacterium]
MRTWRWLAAAGVAIGLLTAGCSDEERGTGDTTPPSPVTDLVVGRPLGNSLTAAWTAPGDDSTIGQATYYDLRYSQEPITEDNWDRATRHNDIGAPFESGVYSGCQVDKLAASTRYYFAIRTGDEAGNWSGLSNVGTGVTAGFSDSIPPAAIADLTVDSTSSSTVTLSWTAPGDDGMAGKASVYDARFSVLPITSEVDWQFSARLVGEPSPSTPGTTQSLVVTGLIPDRQFHFAIRAGDEIINWSGLAGEVVARTAPAESTPPATITDLTVGLVTLTSVQLIWTAPGDDGDIGRATTYDIRFNNYAITDSNWNSSSYVLNEPQPADAGSVQTMTVSGLESFRLYNFAIKTADEIPNWSRVSNSVAVVTNGGMGLEDTLPPARITDLAVVAATATALTLRWRCVGDDNNYGNAIEHDLRYATDSITEQSWATATRVPDVDPPRNAGYVITMDVRNLRPGTTYYFAIKTGDEVPNWAPLSNVTHGTTLPER